jgi:hypothetical protein
MTFEGVQQREAEPGVCRNKHAEEFQSEGWVLSDTASGSVEAFMTLDHHELVRIA